MLHALASSIPSAVTNVPASWGRISAPPASNGISAAEGFLCPEILKSRTLVTRHILVNFVKYRTCNGTLATYIFFSCGLCPGSMACALMLVQSSLRVSAGASIACTSHLAELDADPKASQDTEIMHVHTSNRLQNALPSFVPVTTARSAPLLVTRQLRLVYPRVTHLQAYCLPYIADRFYQGIPRRFVLSHPLPLST